MWLWLWTLTYFCKASTPANLHNALRALPDFVSILVKMSYWAKKFIVIRTSRWIFTKLAILSVFPKNFVFGRDGQLHTSIYDKRDDFNFHITNFPFLSSNIPTSPAYGVFISQLIRYARACSSYGCFILRATRLSNKLLEQGYVKERLKSSFRKFYGRYGDIIKQYEVPLSQMLNDILWPGHIQWQPLTDQTLYRTRPFTEFWVWHADRGRLLLRTPGPLPLWDLQMFFCWDNWHSIIHYTTNSWLFPWFDFLPNFTHFLDLTLPIYDPFPDLISYWIWHYWI